MFQVVVVAMMPLILAPGMSSGCRICRPQVAARPARRAWPWQPNKRGTAQHCHLRLLLPYRTAVSTLVFWLVNRPDNVIRSCIGQPNNDSWTHTQTTQSLGLGSLGLGPWAVPRKQELRWELKPAAARRQASPLSVPDTTNAHAQVYNAAGTTL